MQSLKLNKCNSLDEKQSNKSTTLLGYPKSE
jgi:hypothetical protein